MLSHINNLYKNIIKKINNFLQLEIIIAQKDCIDANSCIAIKKKLNNKFTIIYIFTEDIEIMKYLSFYNKIYFLASFLIKINFIFINVIPNDIYKMVKYYLNTSTKFEFYDQHKSNRNKIDNLYKYKITENKNLNIYFKPNCIYGNTKLFVDYYKYKLTYDQILFFNNIAACHVWNSDHFPDFIFFKIGVNYFSYINNVGMLSDKLLWEISFDSNTSIYYFVKYGKLWYNNILKILNKFINEKKIITYDNYKIIIIDYKELIEPYCNMRMSSVIIYYCNSLSNPCFNTIAIIKNDNVLLKTIKNNNIDLSLLTNNCDGYGDKYMANCKLNNLYKTLNIVN